MIVGLGLDLVEVARFERALIRSPRLIERLFVPAERVLPAQSLAARFAAKEALAKALGSPGNLRWRDCWVEQNTAGFPSLVTTGSVTARMGEIGVTSLHLSLTHDAGVAAAIVIAQN